MVERRNAVPAPCRPDSQPGEHGQGLCRTRVADFRGRNRGPCESHLDQPFGRRPHARETRRVPAGAGAGALGAGAPDRRVGELSRPEGQPEFPRTASAARRHREPYFSGPQGVTKWPRPTTSPCAASRPTWWPSCSGSGRSLTSRLPKAPKPHPGCSFSPAPGRKQRDGTRQRIPSLLCCRRLPTYGSRESGAGRGTG